MQFSCVGYCATVLKCTVDLTGVEMEIRRMLICRIIWSAHLISRVWCYNRICSSNRAMVKPLSSLPFPANPISKSSKKNCIDDERERARRSFTDGSVSNCRPLTYANRIGLTWFAKGRRISFAIGRLTVTFHL